MFMLLLSFDIPSTPLDVIDYDALSFEKQQRTDGCSLPRLFMNTDNYYPDEELRIVLDG